MDYGFVNRKLTPYNRLRTAYNGLRIAYNGLRIAYNGLRIAYNRLRTRYNGLWMIAKNDFEILKIRNLTPLKGTTTTRDYLGRLDLHIALPPFSPSPQILAAAHRDAVMYKPGMQVAPAAAANGGEEDESPWNGPRRRRRAADGGRLRSSTPWVGGGAGTVAADGFAGEGRGARRGRGLGAASPPWRRGRETSAVADAKAG